MTRQPFESCPRFEGCSCNVCPLDPLSALHGGPRVALPGEETCRASQAAREAVAVAYGYPAAWGWLPREARRDRARARWLALPPEERERRRGRLVPFEKGVAAKGGAISPRPGEGDPPRTTQDKGVGS